MTAAQICIKKTDVATCLLCSFFEKVKSTGLKRSGEMAHNRKQPVAMHTPVIMITCGFTKPLSEDVVLTIETGKNLTDNQCSWTQNVALH